MNSSIKKRREEVSSCLVRRMRQTDISKKLGVSRQTIVRDVAFLKESHNWLDGIVKEGFIFEFQLALDRIKDVGTQLEELDKTGNVMEKIVILREIQNNTKLYLELLGETATVHKLRKVMGKTNVPEA
jgi:DNA-binding transcriptional regulator LsrR (DeoR family)